MGRMLRIGGAAGKNRLTLAYDLGKAINHMVHIETIETTWGEEIDKDKGHKFSFLCKQGSPMAFYEGALVMDTDPPTG
jgi:hypothetical protein